MIYVAAQIQRVAASACVRSNSLAQTLSPERTDCILGRMTPKTVAAPLIVPIVVLSLAVSACAAKSKSRRAEDAATEVDNHLRDAERHMRALDVDRAEDSLEDAKEELQNPDLEYHPEATLLKDRYLELLSRLDVVRAEKAKRELELAVEKQRQELERAKTRLLNAAEALSKPESGRREVDEVRGAMEDLSRVLEDGKQYEAKSTSYADDAAHAQRRVEDAKVRLALADARLRFVDGPAAAWTRGQSQFAEAKKEKDLERRQERYTDARRELLQCKEEGSKLTAERAGLAGAAIMVDGKTMSAGSVVTSCEKTIAALDKLAAKNARAVEKAKKKAAKKAKRKK